MSAVSSALLCDSPDGSDGHFPGLNGLAVRDLLQGAVIRGFDPFRMLEDAAIDAAIYGRPEAAIGGRALARLVRTIQFALDDIYLGFLPQGCRLALETERILCLLQASNLGEAIRISVRFTNAMSPDVGAALSSEPDGGLRHACAYRTVAGVDRALLVWLRFVWIYRFFGWLVGRPLTLSGAAVQNVGPAGASGFDVLGCPVDQGVSSDALIYDVGDLTRPLIRRSAKEYQDYYANEFDWFASDFRPPDWGTRTRKAIIDLQRCGIWFPTIEQVAGRLNLTPRQLRHHLAQESDSFQHLRTRLRGDVAGAYLLASDLPIQEIGTLLGFSEPGSFSRHFIAWAGTCPSEYRASHIGDSQAIAAASALLAERRPLRIVTP
jgi:AraC-like DNA-binding protein